MDNGLFITFEGPDGSGKTTQIHLLDEFLKSQGCETILTREPGGTPLGEKLREIILDRGNAEMDYVTETFLYAASRAQHVAQVIRPALKAGKFVICDRFVDSSIAYQGYGRQLGDQVQAINEYAVQGCVPNLTFLMKLDPIAGKKRIDRQLDRMEVEKGAFHREVLRGYLELAQQNPERIVVIDAAGKMEDIAAVIRGKVEHLISLRMVK